MKHQGSLLRLARIHFRDRLTCWHEPFHCFKAFQRRRVAASLSFTFAFGSVTAAAKTVAGVWVLDLKVEC